MFGTRLLASVFCSSLTALSRSETLLPRAPLSAFLLRADVGDGLPALPLLFLWDFSVMPYYRKMPSEIRVRDGLRIEYGKCRIILHFSCFHPATDRRCLSDGISLPDVCILRSPSANQYNPCRLNRLKEDGMNQLKLAVSGAQILFVAFGAMVLVTC